MRDFSVANGGFERSFWVGLTYDNLIISFVSLLNIGKTKCRAACYFNSAMCGMATGHLSEFHFKTLIFKENTLCLKQLKNRVLHLLNY